MRFSKKNNIYQVIRITGSQDNILGISFAEDDLKVNDIEVIGSYSVNSKIKKIRTSKEEVLRQVLFGLELANASLGTNYKLSKIYFSPFDIPFNNVYSVLTSILIRHYHNGNKFIETV